MKFVKASREELEAKLAEAIKTALEKGTVLWLLPGGSNIGSIAKTLEHLAGNNNSGLTLMFADDFYGPPGHADSQEAKLHQAGFNLHGATLVSALGAATPEDALAHYAQEAERLITNTDTVIAFLGVGASGLVAGILPGTPAVYAVNEWVIGYELRGQYRMTLTSFALSHAQIAIVGAFGSEKGAILHSLAEESIIFAEQPAQLLKHIPDVTVYNDQFDAEV